MATDILGDAVGGMIPQISGGQILNWGLIFMFIVLIGIGLAVLTIYVLNLIKYNKKIKLFRRVGNQIIPVLQDRGMFARVGNAGDYWCQLKRFKKILPRPRIQMGKNEFWFYEREDGEWINFSLADFDSQMRKANAYYVDEDMRLQRLGIQKNLRDRFQKVTFWQRYGGMIISIIYILVVTICFVVLFQKMEGAWGEAQSMASAVKEMAMEVRNMRLSEGSGASAVVTGFMLPLTSPLGRWLTRKKKWIFQ